MFSEPFCARQIRAARALLDWSQDDLARATQLSIATIRKIELGYISPRSSTTSALRSSLEEAGIEFTEAEGVKRRKEGVRIYEGAHGCHEFFDDIALTCKKTGKELQAVVSPSPALAHLFGDKIQHHFGLAIDCLGGIFAQIILTDTLALPVSTSNFEFRSISSKYIDPMPFFVYGNKYAVPEVNDDKINNIIVTESVFAAKSFRRHFQSVWDKAFSTPAACPLRTYSEKRHKREAGNLF